MNDSQSTSGLAMLGRLFWMMLGPLALLLMTFFIVSHGSGWFTVADAGFFIALGAMLLGRWLEFRGGNPQKATGEPATQEDLRRYLIIASGVGLVVWVVANLIANHWL